MKARQNNYLKSIYWGKTPLKSIYWGKTPLKSIYWGEHIWKVFIGGNTLKSIYWGKHLEWKEHYPHLIHYYKVSSNHSNQTYEKSDSEQWLLGIYCLHTKVSCDTRWVFKVVSEYWLIIKDTFAIVTSNQKDQADMLPIIFWFGLFRFLFQPQWVI